MLRFMRFLRGYVVLEIYGASTEWALNRLTNARVPFWDICQIDVLTIHISLFQKDIREAVQICERAMCECRTVEKIGVLGFLRPIFRRPVLMSSLVIGISAALLLPSFLLFYHVSGNETVPEDRILRELQSHGVGFGTFGPGIYPRRIRNHIIEKIPELEWITITQNGCRAEVVVREREETPDTENRRDPANIVAANGGIITQLSVFAGQSQCQVGDTVAEGDLLVSGIVDLERVYILERANAEIFARTWRKSDVCIPEEYEVKTSKTRAHRTIWLVIGHKRIKIFGNSGISHSSCDKMITNKPLTLPGGLMIPLRLETEICSHYESESVIMRDLEAELLLQAYTERVAMHQMQSGQILKRNFHLQQQDGIYLMRAVLECQEMIAKTVEVKWNNEE